MPLFKVLPASKRRSNKTEQEVYCPRCVAKPLKSKHTNIGGEGTFRKHENEYECDDCGYIVKVTELYPAINKSR